MLSQLLADVRHAARTLVAHPALTAAATLSLALGIGANTSMFTLVNAVLVRPLPVSAPHELAYLFSGTQDAPWGTSSYPDYVDYRDRQQVFAGLAAYGEIATSLSSDDTPELVRGLIVSGNYFDVLGVRAHLGRAISETDDNDGAGGHPVVAISHGLWQRRFSGDATVIGREILVNGRPFTVVGVLPAGFRGSDALERYDVYVPMAMQAVVRPPRAGYSGEMNPDLLTRRSSSWLSVIGRLGADVSLTQAQSSISVLARQLEQMHPETNRNQVATLFPVSRIDPRGYPALRLAAVLLMTVVGLVLLIATVNVANLLVARALTRRREIAVRVALGASRGRLVQQLLAESLLLALAGGILGLIIAVWAVHVLSQLTPATGMFSFAADFEVDWRVLSFTLAVSVAAALLAGLVPGTQALHIDLVSALKDATGRTDASAGRLALRRALVVAQLSMAIVVLLGAGLFLRSLWNVQRMSPGFDVDRLSVVTLRVDLLRYTRERGQQFYREVVERVAAVPGVAAASLARTVPLGGAGRTNVLRLEGETAQPEERPRIVAVNVVAPRYFTTLGIELLSGRDFDSHDDAASPPVVIVNEAFAKQHWADGSAIGRRLSVGSSREPMAEIVGVVRDSRYRTVGEAPTPFVFQPLGQQHETGVTLFVRYQGDPAAGAADLRRTLLAVEPNLPLSDLQPYRELAASALFPARMAAWLLFVFAGVALLLGAIGVYGVISFMVTKRTPELCIRAALGASRFDLTRLVLREALLLLVAGVSVGCTGALWFGEAVGSFLYGITSSDPLTYVGVVGTLGIITLVAAYVPARRAARADAVTVLRG